MNDPAFLFYPGDYLRDIQALSTNSQHIYDRIMCLHMKNICFSQDQINVLTKNLSEDEKTELFMVLEKSEEGFFIPWVQDSIKKRREYSDSRRKNRKKEKKEDMKNICSTYVQHMENENENENENKEKGGVGEKTKNTIPIRPSLKFETSDLPIPTITAFEQIRDDWRQSGYLFQDSDRPTLDRIVERITTKLSADLGKHRKQITEAEIFEFYLKRLKESDHWQVKNNYSLDTFDRKFSEITASKGTIRPKNGADRYANAKSVL